MRAFCLAKSGQAMRSAMSAPAKNAALVGSLIPDMPEGALERSGASKATPPSALIEADARTLPNRSSLYGNADLEPTRAAPSSAPQDGARTAPPDGDVAAQFDVPKPDGPPTPRANRAVRRAPHGVAPLAAASVRAPMCGGGGDRPASSGPAPCLGTRPRSWCASIVPHPKGRALDTVLQSLFVLSCVALLGFLGAWGITVRRMVGRIEVAHPQAYEVLRARSRKGGRRLAVTSSVQHALSSGGDTLPAEVRADPVCIAMMATESRMRLAMLGAGAASFVFFIVI